MVNGQSGRRKPRIRKAAPTVREKIDSSAKVTQTKPKSRIRPLLALPLRPILLGWRTLKPLLRPMAPLGRLALKVLNWLVPRYFINSWRELRQVTWPNRRETWRLTGAVFIFAVVFGALVAVVDLGLDQIFKRFVLK